MITKKLALKEPRASIAMRWKLAKYFLFLVTLMPGSLVLAQDEPPPRVEERPSVFYMPVNGSSEYKQVSGYWYEKYAKWYKDQLDPPDQLPSIFYTGLTSTATIEGNAVVVEVTMETKPQQQGWLQVPLGFKDAVLRVRPQLSADIESRLNYEADTIGYSCWINITNEEQVNIPLEITYTILAPVSEINNTKQTILNYPEAFSCELEFQLTGNNPWVETSSNAVSEELQIEETKSIKNIRLAGGPLQLRWGFENEAVMMKSPELRVSGSTIMVNIDNENQITTKANLRIESVDGLLTSFDVQISDNAIFVADSAENPEYSVREITSVIEKNQVRKILRVELAEPSTDSVDIELNTIQQRTKQQAQTESFELGVFNVVGSNIQDGDIYLKYKDSVSVTWEDPNALQVEPGVEYYETVKAAFHYPSQPHELKIRVKPSRTSLTIQPSYRLILDEYEAQLESAFLVSTPASFSGDLSFDIGNWTIEEVGPLESSSRWDREINGKKLILSLANSNTTENGVNVSGREERIVIKSRIDLQSNDQIFTIPWIVPLANQVEYSPVVVVSPSNLLVTPLFNQMPDFRLDRLTESEENANESHFRFLPTAKASNFVAKIETLPSRLSVESQAHITLNRLMGQTEIVQTFAITSFHKKLPSLLFQFPDNSVVPASLIVKIDDQEVSFDIATPEDGTSLQANQIRVALPEGTQRDQVELKYTLDAEENDSPGLISVQLFQPAIEQPMEAQLNSRSTELQITSPQTVSIDSSDSNILELPTEPENDNGANQFFTVKSPVSQFELQLAEPSQIIPGEILVEQAWIQSIYLQDKRRDRVSYLLETERTEIVIDLPEGVTQVLELRLNQRPLEQYTLIANQDSKPQLKISLADRSLEEEKVLEFWYDIDFNAASVPLSSLQVPQILDAVQVNKTFLQIAAPENWVCLGTSAWNSEMQWDWKNFQLQRIAELTQKDLEKLAHASEQGAIMPGLEAYLFSTVGTPSESSVTFVRKSHLFLLLSGSTLLIGLLLIYLPSIRRGWVLWTLAVVLFACSLIYPITTILIGQLAGLGIILALLSMILSVVLTWMKPQRSVVRGIAGESHLSTQFFKEGEPVSNHSTATLAAQPGSSISQPKT